MGELIALLFLARDLAHRAHLKTKSYAEHEALGAFYEEIVGKADAIAEAWQGRFGKFLDIPLLSADAGEDIKRVLEKHSEWLRKHRYAVVPKEEATIQNLIDEAISVYLTALYKLRFLS